MRLTGNGLRPQTRLLAVSYWAEILNVITQVFPKKCLKLAPFSFLHNNLVKNTSTVTFSYDEMPKIYI